MVCMRGQKLRLDLKDEVDIIAVSRVCGSYLWNLETEIHRAMPYNISCFQTTVDSIVCERVFVFLVLSSS